VRSAIVVVCVTAATVGCFTRRVAHPELAAPNAAVTLTGQFSIPSGQRFPEIAGLAFGGISALIANPGARNELFGVSDAQRDGRIYRLAIQRTGSPFTVSAIDIIFLEAPPGDPHPNDFEGLVILPDGRFLVSSEGSGREPRRPPAIAVYGSHGEFVDTLPVRDRYVPEVTGSLTKGARGNAGFESLALAPDGSLFTAVETALVQDGDPANFDRGTRTRVLEYKRRRGGFEPAREFVYELDALPRPGFAPGFYINGLVELLVVDSTTLLALERGYVEALDDPSTGMSHIRVYRISFTGATDVSPLDSLKDRSDIVPVRKTLLLDLSNTAGLDRDLAPSLDNFEGMAFGPRLPDGRPTLILVSDDNFSPRQRTWFLEFAIGSGAGPKTTKTGLK
jgi:hypothetical protein